MLMGGSTLLWLSAGDLTKKASVVEQDCSQIPGSASRELGLISVSTTPCAHPNSQSSCSSLEGSKLGLGTSCLNPPRHILNLKLTRTQDASVTKGWNSILLVDLLIVLACKHIGEMQQTRIMS